MAPPLVLDFDGSVRGLGGEQTIALADWQEAIRFGCSHARWRALAAHLQARLPSTHGTVFLGSGDFHHLSHLLIGRRDPGQTCDVVVLDNHPDNMRFPFGIHCGSWVRHSVAWPWVGTIHVLGITSADVTWRHAWENHLLPLYRGRVRYWTIGVATSWATPLGLSGAVASFPTAAALVAAFIAFLASQRRPVYLSIDKDVLDPAVARTNWDQGCLALADVQHLIAALTGRLVGSDVTGEVSAYRYRAGWKRWLSALDDQPAVAADQLAGWQAQQNAVNRQLLGWIRAAGG